MKRNLAHFVELILLILVGFAASVAARAAENGLPRVVNAKAEKRSAAGLEAAFKALVTSQDSPAWAGYAVPEITNHRETCCSDWSDDVSDSRRCRCRLEGGDRSVHMSSDEASPVRLEGPRNLVILFRVAGKRVEKIRLFDDSCELDASGLPFIWFTEVRPAESVALLSSFVLSSSGDSGENKHLQEPALAAIAMTADAAADQAFAKFIDPHQPETLRKRASFWLGAARGHSGYELLRRMAAGDPSEHVRKEVTFALSVSSDSQAVEEMIHMARNDSSTAVRGQALFWLAQKAGTKVTSTIAAAAENDPDTDVKKKAVFALSQLPKEEGVPLLIQVARTNRNAAVRKQALFWLGQSNDPRALAFFEEVLAH